MKTRPSIGVHEMLKLDSYDEETKKRPADENGFS